MTLGTLHPGRLAAASGAMLALIAAALIMLSSGGTGGRAMLLQQLERPALYPSTMVGPHPVATSVAAGAYRIRLTIAPNRAAARNTVSIVITRHGFPVKGARATVTYSMPAMAMQNALISTLRESRPAGYSVREPILGMPGSWAMRFAVRPPSGRGFAVTVNDLLR